MTRAIWHTDMPPVEVLLRAYHSRLEMVPSEKWVPYSNVLLKAAEEIDRLKKENAELIAKMQTRVLL